MEIRSRAFGSSGGLRSRGAFRPCGAAGFCGAVLGAVALSCAILGAGDRGAAPPKWKLAVQAWTFHDMTLFEAIEKTRAAGVECIEAFPGQRLSREEPNVSFDHNAPVSVLAKVKKKLDREGVKLVAYGVVGLGRDEAENRKVFDFAKLMGIGTIVSEPEPGSFELIDKLAEEYGIDVAIHNHPKPSRYWSPEAVLEAVKGRSKRIGACADTGHWMRSGVNPLEALRKLEGRIVSAHFKDLGEFGNPAAHDVVWGTGKADAKALLEELHRQGFSGAVSIEYEHNWGKSLPEVAACAKFFKAVSEELSKRASGS